MSKFSDMTEWQRVLFLMAKGAEAMAREREAHGYHSGSTPLYSTDDLLAAGALVTKWHGAKKGSDIIADTSMAQMRETLKRPTHERWQQRWPEKS